MSAIPRMKTRLIQFKVNGMTCDHCEKTIEATLREMPHVAAKAPDPLPITAIFVLRSPFRAVSLLVPLRSTVYLLT